MPVGIAAYGFAAWRYVAIYRERRRPLPLAVAMSFVLLAEALVAVALSRAWRISWWEWHVLMAIAFATILLAARSEYREERSLVGAFGGPVHAADARAGRPRADRRRSTMLARADARRHRRRDRGRAAARGLHRGRDRDAAAGRPRELSRIDELLRRYVGPQLAERLGDDPGCPSWAGTSRRSRSCSPTSPGSRRSPRGGPPRR